MKAISATTDDGKEVYLALTDDVVVVARPVTGEGGTAGVGDLLENLQDRVRDVGDTIVKVCDTIRNRVTTGMKDTKPSELTLKFGVTLAGETGIPLVTKGSAEASFEVEAKWNLE